MGEAKKNPVIAVFAAPSPLNMTEPAAEFSLKDQFSATRNYSFPRAKVSVLLFSDREGFEQLEGWIRPLVERFDNRVDVQGVAVLSSVPRLARPAVASHHEAPSHVSGDARLERRRFRQLRL